MTRALILGAIALTATLAVAGQAQLPPHQMRAQVDNSNRLKPVSEGAALFSQRCGACHLAFGMGTNLISARQAAAGQKPVGLLAERDDLVADYVKAVARQGKGAMPRQTKVDITDAELDKVAAFLGKGK